jgi:hypothetical protein
MPSGENATRLTGAEGPLRVSVGRAVVVFHNRTVLS